MKTKQTIMKTIQTAAFVFLSLSLSAQTIIVDGKKTWTDTGIDVVKGQKISITATGTVYANATVSGGPEGIFNRPDWDTYCVIKGKPHVGLIMKIGNGPAVFVGKALNYTAPLSGRIYLGVNDKDVGNNKGEFTAILYLSKISPVGGGKIKVSGKQTWTTTGIRISKGQHVKITASGKVYANATVCGGPDGIPNRPDWDIYSVVKGKPHAGLTAKIGTGNAFFVGSSLSFTARDSGELFFRVNDNDLGNNKGEFSVSVKVK